jgi:hypothetical protein
VIGSSQMHSLVLHVPFCVTAETCPTSHRTVVSTTSDNRDRLWILIRGISPLRQAEASLAERGSVQRQEETLCSRGTSSDCKDSLERKKFRLA